MPEEYNIYCDESCHIEFDRQVVMLLGAVWCPKAEVKQVSEEIRSIKSKYNAHLELKWIKVTKAKLSFYKELVRYFFENKNLYFRCLVVEDKSKLNHEFFNKGSHENFYYKMYFSMLKTILSPTRRYNIYIDIKDTRSKYKIKLLKEVLCNNVYDFTQQMIARIQHIRSHESELLQLADFLIGAVSYKNRNLKTSSSKLEIVGWIEKMAKHSLNMSTSLHENKFNLFVFSPLNAK